VTALLATTWHGMTGGIYSSNFDYFENFADSLFTVTNSTISGNIAGNNGGGIYHRTTHSGNGTNAELQLSYNTVMGNIASGQGGGLYQVGGAVRMINTILAKNNRVLANAQSFEWIVRPNDCAGNLISQGYNLIQNTTDCLIRGNINGNLIGLDPLFGPLADNGGHALTHALLQGSPAIDAGNSTLSNLPLFDQRGTGFRRVLGRRIDIGAFESTTLALVYLPVISISVTDCKSVTSKIYNCVR